MITPRLVVTFVFLAAVLAAAMALHDPGPIPDAPRAILPQAAALPGSSADGRADARGVSSPREDWAVSHGDRLTPGFPARLLGPAPGSRVLTSRVAGMSGTQQVALVAATRAAPLAVLRHYRAVLGSVGFREQPTGRVAGSLVATFLRGADTVVVTAAAERSTTYSVYAGLHPGVVP